MTLTKSRAIIGKHKLLLIVFFAIYLMQLMSGGLIIYFTTMQQTKSFIENISQLANQDITLKNNQWDTSKYDADPRIPGDYRLYVFTKDGYVIDRWRPIPGYLDTADYKHLISYQTAQDIKTIAGQDWRVLSVPLTNNKGDRVGVVTVGRYEFDHDDVDKELKETVNWIRSQIIVGGQNIDTSKINARDVSFETSFLVVDQYNRIHIKSDHSNSFDKLPNYIDPSYISNLLNNPTLRIVKSTSGYRKQFLVKTTPITVANEPVGVIVVGKTIDPNISLIKWYLLLQGIAVLIIIILCLLWLINVGYKTYTNELQHTTKPTIGLKDIYSIIFSKDDCVLKINDQEVAVTYASNQYYMCLALFAAPKKKWETDELLDKFGEENHRDGWRKIYDAMNSINKKVGAIADAKLFITNNKTYQLNPDLVDKLNK